MRIHTIIDIKRPDNVIGVRDLMMKLDANVEVNLPNGEVAQGIFKAFEMMTDRMVVMTVDIHDRYAYLFPDEQVDEHEEFDDWYDYDVCIDIEED